MSTTVSHGTTLEDCHLVLPLVDLFLNDAEQVRDVLGIEVLLLRVAQNSRVDEVLDGRASEVAQDPARDQPGQQFLLGLFEDHALSLLLPLPTLGFFLTSVVGGLHSLHFQQFCFTLSFIAGLMLPHFLALPVLQRLDACRLQCLSHEHLEHRLSLQFKVEQFPVLDLRLLVPACRVRNEFGCRRSVHVKVWFDRSLVHSLLLQFRYPPSPLPYPTAA